MKRIRELHLYLGMFLAPTIIFFALSGALQIFRLQDARPGSTYQPPTWIVVLAGVHKDQRLAGPPAPRPAVPPSAPAVEAASAPKPAAPPPEGQQPKRKPSTILKWFFLLAAIGIIASTVLGILMAFNYNRDRRIIWGLLAAGTLLPIVMLFL